MTGWLQGRGRLCGTCLLALPRLQVWHEVLTGGVEVQRAKRVATCVRCPCCLLCPCRGARLRHALCTVTTPWPLLH